MRAQARVLEHTTAARFYTHIHASYTYSVHVKDPNCFFFVYKYITIIFVVVFKRKASPLLLALLFFRKHGMRKVI